jgi:hypothetical protein
MIRALATTPGRGDNIKVNAILPGWIDTELTRNAPRQVEGLHGRVEARTPAGRWDVPWDLSGIAAFIAGPASDCVTGAAIPVDGGLSISMAGSRSRCDRAAVMPPPPFSRRSTSLPHQVLKRLPYDLEPELFGLGQVGCCRKVIQLANDLSGSGDDIGAIAWK